MSVNVTPHLNFRGQAREALECYRRVFGGALTLTTYAEVGGTGDPTEADLVVWGQVAAEGGFRVMAYDVPAARPWSRGEDPFFVSVRGGDADELTAAWERLVEEDATVIVPLASSDWAVLYGMLRDRFGVTWVLDLPASR